MRTVRLFACALACFASACSYDLSVPEPQRGSVSGALDTQGYVPAEGVTLLLVDERGSERSQETAADGTFSFTDLPPGLYYLDAAVPGFAPMIRPNLRVLSGKDLDLGTLSPTWLAGTSQEATLTGKVVVGGGGDPYGGQVEFVLEELGQRVAIAPIALDGTFTQRVPPGTYTLRAVHPLFVTAEVKGVSVAAAALMDLSTQPLTLDVNPAKLSGTVYKERDQQSPVPAEGVLVTLGSGATTTTDATGKFLLEGLPAGASTVRFTLAGFHDPLPPRPVTLAPGETTQLEDAQLAVDRGTIIGTVQLADGQPATDVTVAVTGTSYAALAAPDPNVPSQATFALTGIPAGTYEVSATKGKYARAVKAPVTVTAGTVDAGAFLLTLLQGDFVIDDGVSGNTAGYTATPQVTLTFSNLPALQDIRASEDPAFTGASYQPLSGNALPFTLTGGDGTRTVYVQYRDTNGVAGPVLSSSIVLDTQAPAAVSATLEGGAAFTQHATVLSLTIDGSDAPGLGVDRSSGLALARVSATGAVDGNGNLTASAVPYQRQTVFSRPGSSDGVQDVFVQLVDHAGNASAIATASIVVDTVPPSGSISIADGAGATAPGFTASPLVTISQSAAVEPNGGSVRIRLANDANGLASATLQPLQSSAGWFLNPSTTGAKTVFAELVDAAGNVSTTSLQAMVTFDPTPPSPVSVSVQGASVTNQGSVTLLLSALDDEQLSPTEAVTVSESPLFSGPGTVGPMAMPGTGTLTFTLGTQQGPRAVFVRYKDAAGNTAVTSAQVTFDDVAPTGSFTVTGALADGTPSSTITSTSSVTLTLQTDATLYAIGNETLATCPSSAASYQPLPGLTLSHTLSGSASPRQVRLCFRDAAGNVTGPVTRTIALDAAAPSGCSLSVTGTRVDGSAAPSGKTGNPNVTVNTVSCSEPPAEIALTTGTPTCSATTPQSWIPFQAALPFLLPGPDGVSTVRGCVRDAARNTAAVTAGTITLDTQPPTNPLVTIDSGAAYVNAAQVAARGGNKAQVIGSANGATEWAIAEAPGVPTAFSPYTAPSTSVPAFTFAGTGTRTLYAVFRDEVGNTSAVASDDIVFDITAPSTSGVTLSVAPTGGVAGYVNSVSATLILNGVSASDVPSVLLANAAGSACTGSDLAGATLVPRFLSTTYVLPPVDGTKVICLALVDTAGNVSSTLSTSVVLDTAPPTGLEPVVDTAILKVDPLTLKPNAYTVDVKAPTSDANFLRYERVGGTASAWTPDATTVGTTAFTFNLDISTSADTGKLNVLRVRALDKAGNAGPEAQVSVFPDAKRPLPVTLNNLWVHNGDRTAIFYWKPPVSQVSTYYIYYGSSSGTYDGAYANEGTSPIAIAPTDHFTLSGLVNGSPTYVQVIAEDQAGHRSNVPLATPEVVLQPNAISPDPIDLVPLSMTRVFRLVPYGDRIYAAGTSGADPNGNAVLQPIDVSQIVSPLQNIPGAGPIASPAGPVAKPALTFADGLDFFGVSQGGVDLVVDSGYAFMASGSVVRIFSLADPDAPSLVSTLNFAPAVMGGLALRGDVLFVGGRDSKIRAVSVADLFDGNASTQVTTADLIGTATGGTTVPESLAISRNALVMTTYQGGSILYFDVADAVDDNALTPWDGTDKIGSQALGITSWSRPLVSGNHLLLPGASSVSLFDLSPAWGGSPPSNNLLFSAAVGVSGTIAFAGPELFLPAFSVDQIQSVDLMDLAAPQVAGSTYYPGTGVYSATLVYGNYLFVGTIGQGLLVLEAATPKTPRLISSVPKGGPRGALSGDFLYSSGTFDLTSGPSPVVTGPMGTCVYDEAVVDEDVLVRAFGTYLSIFDLRDANDRDAATVFNASDETLMALSSQVVRATGVEAFGNFLVVAEQRGDGTYLEVFDVRKLRDGLPGTTLTLADSRGAYKVTANTGWAEVTMHLGRAFVTLEGAGQGLYVVDLRPMLDDSAATAMVPITTTPNQVQGFVAGSTPAPGFGLVPLLATTVVRGHYAYVAGNAGLEIIDISEALDDDLSTTLPVSPTRALWSKKGVRGVEVYGSYAYLATMDGGGGGASFNVLDVSDPLQPKNIANMPWSASGVYCTVGSFVSQPMRASITVSGTRAYATSFGKLSAYELE